jgi:hypothetical protein
MLWSAVLHLLLDRYETVLHKAGAVLASPPDVCRLLPTQLLTCSCATGQAASRPVRRPQYASAARQQAATNSDVLARWDATIACQAVTAIASRTAISTVHNTNVCFCVHAHCIRTKAPAVSQVAVSVVNSATRLFGCAVIAEAGCWSLTAG